MQWETVIGLEIHVQLATQSKLFSGATNQFGAQANANACPIDLGFPGTLPVINQTAVRMACLFGLAVDAKINQDCFFDRKNYFYPDLPKGYQISQSEKPIVDGGSITLKTTGQVVQLTRAHLEEDAGKSIHGVVHGQSGIDLNRAGTPLLEIVSEPELHNAEDAAEYFRSIQNLVRYLKISDGNMAEGSLRCDANVSIRPLGSTTLGKRAEVKNLNSFRFIEKAINYEVSRQIYALENDLPLQQETRLYDPDKDETRSMRSKEDANDYRYFPDPDLLPLNISNELLELLKLELPELASNKFKRYQIDYKLNDYDAEQLSVSIDTATYFEHTLAQAANHQPTPKIAKLCANWILGELFAALNKHQTQIQASPVTPKQLGQLVHLVANDTISANAGKTVFEELYTHPSEDTEAAFNIVEAQGLQQISDTSAIEVIINEVITAHPEQLTQYINAPPEKRQKMTGFFIGQIMKQTQGKANPKTIKELLHKALAQHCAS